MGHHSHTFAPNSVIKFAKFSIEVQKSEGFQA